MNILSSTFFNRDACVVAQELLGKIIRRKYKQQWLAARIIETEAFYLIEKGSHASLGYTEKRKALFMQGGTIYMYYAHGKDSFNISCRGKGNAVLIKSAFPYIDTLSTPGTIALMQSLNSHPSKKTRPLESLCNGQTLLCRSLALKVTEWDQAPFDPEQLYIDNVHIKPEKIIQTTRLRIPKGRDEFLPYRFIDLNFAKHCTQNPLTKRIKNPMTIIDNINK